MLTVFELEKMIVMAAEAYYLDEPRIPDELFDKYVEELRIQKPSSSLLTQVGWGCMRKVYRNKVPLPVKILVSLPKVQYKDFLFHGEMTASPKVDGMSCVLHYSGGILKQAVTRGDGEFGIDITPKMRKIGVPNQIRSEGEKFIRGELYLDTRTFQSYLASEYANPRNAVAGIVNSKSYDRLEFVTFGAHPQDDITCLEHHDQELLKMLPEWIVRTKLHIEEARKFSIDDGYPIDGIVLHKTGLEDAIAIKFETESVETIVSRVEWEERRGGKMIPIVWYDPVQLYGTTCNKCSGFNYSYIKDNNIGPGAMIRLTKANEIIPYITEVVSPGVFQSMEDEFHTVEGAHLFHSKFDQYRAALKHFVAWHYNIDGFKRPEIILSALGATTFQGLIDSITCMTRKGIILSLNTHGVYSIAEKVVDKLKSKIYINNFFQQFAINGIGPVEAEKLQLFIEEYCNNTTIGITQLLEKIGVRSNVKAELCKNEIYAIIAEAYNSYENANLWEEWIPIEEVGSAHKVKFCISGRLSSGLKKVEFAKLMPDDYMMVDYVDPNVILLISDETNTAKVQKAKKLRIQTLTEAEARRVFKIETSR
jgi:DNA ligase (NAD+)